MGARVGGGTFTRAIFDSFLVLCSEKRTETLATQASGLSEFYFCFFFSLMHSRSKHTTGSRNEKSKVYDAFSFLGHDPNQKIDFF